MPTMVTFQAGRIALVALLLGLVAACSDEQQDWHSAQSADTTEAWQRFIEQHPDSELILQARARIVQLGEQRDWQHADGVATVEAYRAFLSQHPNGRWAEEARIRIEAFSLGSAPRITPATPREAAATPDARGVRALELATGPAPAVSPAPGPPPVATPVPAGMPATLAQPGEAAQPEGAAAPPLAGVPPANTQSDVPVPDGYAVQLGAFGSAASADREWQRLQERFGTQLGGLSPRIVLASTDLGQLYRLQAGAAGEAEARAICDSLREQSQACVPVIRR
jgi:cell division septation protein DedD